MDFLPFSEAVEYIKQKGLMPTSLSSAELSELSADIRRRAIFSAGVEKASLLQSLKDEAEKIVGMERDEHGRIRDLPMARLELKRAMEDVGLSSGRQKLMIETLVNDTRGYGQWLRGQERIALDMSPALELIRTIDPLGAPRNWVQRWIDAAEETNWEGVSDPTSGRMVALKNHPIWQALGDGAGGHDDTLGNPWAPFAFNSGMRTAEVPRKEAVELGLLSADATIEPDDSVGLNDNLEAQADGLDIAALGDLAKQGMELIGGVLRLVNGRTHTVRNRLQGILSLMEGRLAA